MKGETMKAQAAKPFFYNICIEHQFNSQKLQEIATLSGVSMGVIEAMCNGSAVGRTDAEKVLAAFSQFTHCTWTLNNVNVLVLATFADLYEVHEFDTASLSIQAGIPIVIVDQMLCDEKVAKGHARSVLQTLSSLLGRSYTLENVAVKLSDGKVQHG
jgi:hypothetical protein